MVHPHTVPLPRGALLTWRAMCGYRYDCPGEEAFVMTLGQFWAFVRDVDLASPRHPLADLDRLLLKVKPPCVTTM